MPAIVSASYCEPFAIPPSSMFSAPVGLSMKLPPNVTLAGLLPGLRSPTNSTVPPPVKEPAPVTVAEEDGAATGNGSDFTIVDDVVVERDRARTSGDDDAAGRVVDVAKNVGDSGTKRRDAVVRQAVAAGAAELPRKTPRPEITPPTEVGKCLRVFDDAAGELDRAEIGAEHIDDEVIVGFGANDTGHRVVEPAVESASALNVSLGVLL